MGVEAAVAPSSDDDPQPASRKAAISAVVASLTASPPYSITLVIQTRRERQPGDREPAPGHLWLVQAFVNSRWNLESELEDQFADREGLAKWLIDRELVPTATRVSDRDLRRAREARDGLQALMFWNNRAPFDREAIGKLDRALHAPGPFVQLGADSSPDFVPSSPDVDGVLGLIGTITAISQLDGTWIRLKACPGDDCGWAFYDHSRNQGGTWCSMSVCGARSKARDYRRRKRRSHH